MIEVLSTLSALIHYITLTLFGVALMSLFLNIPKTRRNIFTLLLLAVVLLVIQLMFFLQGGETTVTRLYPLITHLPLVLFFILYYKKHFFPVLLSLTISYLCCQIVNWIELTAQLLGAPVISTDLIASILLFILGALISRFFSDSIARLLNHNNRQLIIYAIIPFTYYIYDYGVTVYTDLIQIPNIIAIEFMPFVISFVYLVFCAVYHEQYEAHYEEKRKAQLLSMQLQQYESMQARIEETRRAKHDLRQHLRLINAYLENKDTAALEEYIKRYGESLPEDVERRFCDNAVADAVARFYSLKAKEQNIEFDANLNLAASLQISEPDLCVLLGNLLENALDECLRHPDEHCKIKLSGQIRGSRTLIITVDNTPAFHPSIVEGKLLSSKSSREEGIGTYSIKNIAERYNGQAMFEWKAGVFYASVVMTLPAK